MHSLRPLHSVLVRLAAGFLLAAMLFLMLRSVQEDALTMDEPTHITAGYTALRWRNARLNPEHPPLLKLLTALPLLPLPLNFPLTHPAWQDTIDEPWKAAYQFEIAGAFLYESGNDPHRIAARARLAPIGMTVGLGILLFLWAQHFAEATAALLTLACYSFSPTILAHGRLVTTDVAAAFGVALAGCACIRFLTHPSPATALISGLTLGVALLLKFSTVLLVPFGAALLLLWIALEPTRRRCALAGAVIIGGSAALLVLLPYLWMTSRYPPEQQFRESYAALFQYAGGPLGRTEAATATVDVAHLATDRTRDLRACLRRLTALQLACLPRCPAELAIFLADKPLVRAWGDYFLGVLLATWRASAGDLTYFRGEVSASGSRSYFPIVYAIKEPLAFHLLTAIALLLALTRVWSRPWGSQAVGAWLRRHPAELFMLGWLALYWSGAITSRLNLGIRHLLPVFPFTLLLVARELARWLVRAPEASVRAIHRTGIRGLVVVGLLLWQVVSVVRVYPSFLAYFNEAAGGPAGGARYVVDSNVDWGQDLRRLRAFVEACQIDQIAVDYFGGGWPASELGEKYIPWESAKGPYAGWLAVSVSRLQLAQARWDPALDHPAAEAYAWLQGKALVAQIGYSIAVFDLRNNGYFPIKVRKCP
jgi:4-amino-4-deoxy-L-arabinose transferase-like glycosyltransferase